MTWSYANDLVIVSVEFGFVVSPFIDTDNKSFTEPINLLKYLSNNPATRCELISCPCRLWFT